MTLASVLTYHDDLRAAFRTALRDITTSAAGIAVPALDQVDWEGQAFSSTIGTPWMRERQVEVSSVSFAKGVTHHTVLCVATLFFPSGKGTLIAGRAAGIVAATFPFGHALAYANMAALCMKTERKPAIVEPDWISVPVIVTTVGHTYD